jgi:two-component system, response regulator PdtaR
MRHLASYERSVVLVVEDDPLIRMVAVDLVADLGFPVCEAGGADEALGALESRRDVFALFTDVNMPGTMDGLELAHLVRQRWPSLGLIVTSGRAPPPSVEMPRGSVFLPKPYSGAQLAQKLQQVVGEAGFTATSR